MFARGVGGVGLCPSFLPQDLRSRLDAMKHLNGSADIKRVRAFGQRKKGIRNLQSA